MLCLDTSSLIAYLQGDSGADVGLIDQALVDQVGAISPVTVAELLSDPDLSSTLKQTILELPVLQILEGFRANLADTLIAQSCLDHQATLVTRDRDFKAFVSVSGLRLAVPFL